MNVTIAQSDVATAYGWGLQPLWNGLLSGRTAIKSTDRFAGRGFVSTQMALVPDVCIEPGSSRAMAMLKRSLAPLIDNIDPQTMLILATTVGEIEYIERSVLEEKPELSVEARPAALLERVRSMLGLLGPTLVLSSACASSATAVSRAASFIRQGFTPGVLVVSVDAVSEFVYSGFSTLLSLCDEPARPFDAQRGGLTLGEAAAWVHLKPGEDSSTAKTSIVGWGNTTDAVHMTAPDRNAGGLSRAIAKACAMSCRSPADVAFIAAHGTATLYSDAMELVAFRAAFGDPKPIFSVKGGVGHTLAAAGLVQILVAAEAMRLGIVPPTVGLSTPDDAAIGWARPSSFALSRTPSLALSTNSGFGGVNTAVLLGTLA